MTEWNVVKLGDICSITSSKRIFAKEYQTEGIPFYRGKEIIEKHNGNEVSTELFITRERYDEIKNKFDVPQRGDILLSSVGTLGVPWLVDEEEFYFKDGNLTWLRCNDKTSPEFLYLWLNSPEAQNQIDTMCIGSTQKALTIETLKKFDVTLPTLEDQDKICGVITPISKKITVNRATNRNLYEQLKNLFIHQYLEVADEKEQWKDTCIGDITSKFATGLNPRKNFVLGQGENYYVTIKNMSNNRIYLDDRCDKVDDCALVKINNRSDLKKGDLLFSGIATIGRVHLIDDNANNWNISESVFTLRPVTTVSSEFLYLLLLSDGVQGYTNSLASGSAQRGIRKADFVKYELKLPNEEDMVSLTSQWKPLIDIIKINEKENDRFAQLRDSLLPKLMSGELDISELEI